MSFLLKQLTANLTIGPALTALDKTESLIRRICEQKFFGKTVLFLTAFLVYLRLYYGVDFTDESFYSAMPYSFLLGARPFHEELNITQQAGIILTPVYWVFYHLTGSSLGIILFNRHLFFLSLSASSYLTYRLCQHYIDKSLSMLIAAVVFCCLYFNIPALSYNTLGSFLLYDALFLLVLSRNEGRSHLIICAATVCLALAAFAYPPLSPVSAVAFLYVGASLVIKKCSRKQKSIELISWCVLLFVIILAGFSYYCHVGRENLQRMVEYTMGIGYDPASSLRKTALALLVQARQLFPTAIKLVFFCISLLYTTRWFGKSRYVLVCVFCILFFTLRYLHQELSTLNYPTIVMPVIIVWGIFLMISACLFRLRNLAHDAALVGLLSGLAAMVIGFSSTNRLVATSLGLFPAAIFFLLCLCVICCPKSDNGMNSPRAEKAILSLFLSSIIALGLLSVLEVSYRDAPILRSDNFLIATGPFAGLRTTKKKAALLGAMTKDLSNLESKGSTLFVEGDFPAGYLLTRQRPRTFSTWILLPHTSEVRDRLYADLFQSNSTSPDLVLRVGFLRDRYSFSGGHQRYRRIIARPEYEYEIFVREK